MKLVVMFPAGGKRRDDIGIEPSGERPDYTTIFEAFYP